MSDLFKGYPCALPDKMVRDPKGRMVNLRDAKHWDWVWPFSNIPRAFNARGPRCRGLFCPYHCDGGGYRAWPPRLVEGYGISRWESDGAQSILYIPAMDDLRVTGHSVYGQEWIVYEMNPSAPNFGVKQRVKLGWREGTYMPGQYSPSALQKFSRKGWMRLFPEYKASWRILDSNFPRHIDLARSTGFRELLQEWKKAPNYRINHRPDHVDLYYNVGNIRPYVGLKFE